MSKIKQNKTRIQQAIVFHTSKKMRRRWAYCCFFNYFCTLCIFIAGAALLTIEGVKFNQNSTSQYEYNNGNIICIIVGVIIICIGLIFGIWLSIYLPYVYKESRDLYFQTKEYKQKRLKYMEADLTNEPIRELKWLKKLGYIDNVKFEATKLAIKKIKLNN